MRLRKMECRRLVTDFVEGLTGTADDLCNLQDFQEGHNRDFKIRSLGDRNLSI